MKVTFIAATSKRFNIAGIKIANEAKHLNLFHDFNYTQKPIAVLTVEKTETELKVSGDIDPKYFPLFPKVGYKLIPDKENTEKLVNSCEVFCVSLDEAANEDETILALSAQLPAETKEEEQS